MLTEWHNDTHTCPHTKQRLWQRWKKVALSCDQLWKLIGFLSGWSLRAVPKRSNSFWSFRWINNFGVRKRISIVSVRWGSHTGLNDWFRDRTSKLKAYPQRSTSGEKDIIMNLFSAFPKWLTHRHTYTACSIYCILTVFFRNAEPLLHIYICEHVLFKQTVLYYINLADAFSEVLVKTKSHWNKYKHKPDKLQICRKVAAIHSCEQVWFSQ